MARAGVVSAVRGGALGSGWVAPVMVPGERPRAALVAACAPLVEQSVRDVGALGRRVEADPMVLAPLLSVRGGRIVLVIDQFEEVVTVASPDERKAFAVVLSALVAARAVRVLLTVRSDFLGRLDSLSELAELDVLRGAIVLPPLSPEGLRRAVVEPAALRGYRFEPDVLPDRFVEAGEGGALPLLEFALSELWERRDAERRVLGAAGMDERGAIAGALARHADAVIADLDGATRQEARRLAGRETPRAPTPWSRRAPATGAGSGWASPPLAVPS